MSNDDYTEAQPDVLERDAGLDVGDPKPTTAVIVPAPITAEIKSGKPLSPVTYDGMLLQIDLVRDAATARTNLFKVMAIEALAKAANNFEAERQCREIRLAADYALAERLSETERHKGGQHSKKKLSSNVTGAENPSSKVTGTEAPPTLDELGVSRNKSMLYKDLTKIPKDTFFTLLKGPVAKGQKVSKGQKLPTLTGIMRLAGVAKTKKTTKPKTPDNNDPYAKVWQHIDALAVLQKTLKPKGAAEMGSKAVNGRKKLQAAIELLTNIDDLMVAPRVAQKAKVA